MAAPQRVQRLKSIGKSLEIYLRRVRDHVSMMEREQVEFERGKRHLANIMGWDPQMEIKQDDIDHAIEYLFPSGLHGDQKPVMKPPHMILPKMRTFAFDEEGRPADPLFYTLRPKFYALLSSCGLKAQRLNNYHDERLLRRIGDIEGEEVILTGSSWLSNKDLSAKLGERLPDILYANLIAALEHLASLPYAHLEKDFIMEYRTSGLAGYNKPEIFRSTIPDVQVDPETNQRFAVGRGAVKRTRVSVKVSDAGTGKFFFEGHPLSEFRSILARENMMAPLILTGKLGQVDVESHLIVGPGGESVIPRAIRHGLALGLVALYPEHKQTLNFAGYLTNDIRRKERNKVNQPGARAKWIWKKR